MSGTKVMKEQIFNAISHLEYSQNYLQLTTNFHEFQGEPNKDSNLRRQGSFRKLLPLNANGDSQLSMSVKMIDRPTVSQTNKEYAVYLQEYNIFSEQ